MSEITWRCSACGFLVANHDGYLGVDEVAASALQIEMDRLLKEDGPFDIPAVVRLPPVEKWRVLHTECEPEETTAAGYYFEIHRVRTHADLLARTADLMDKSWLRGTDWQHLIERAGRGERTLAP